MYALQKNSHFYQKSTESQDYLFLFSRQVLSSSRYNVGGSWSYSNVIHNNEYFRWQIEDTHTSLMPVCRTL